MHLKKFRDSVLEFSVSDLRMPSSEDVIDRATNRNWTKNILPLFFLELFCVI
jgi:hypothetical protein